MRLNDESLQQLAADAGLTSASAVVMALDSPQSGVALRPDAYLYPASMIKVPLAAAVLATVPAERTLATPLTVTADNMTVNDAASPLEPGYEATLGELLRLAITRSDNVATNMLYDVLGRQRATEYARSALGLAATAFQRKLSGSQPLIADPQWDGTSRNSHSAADAAALFAAITGYAIPHAGLLFEMLSAQEWNDKLNAGLREGDRFAHKTGDTDEVTHDGGILTTADGRRYVVVVYTPLQSTPEHNARFGPFMRELRALL